jgi:AcrR family transcriptional regulator
MCDTRPMPAEANRSQPRAARRDAVANREKILRTAAGLMARRGHKVPLTEIADAAGVGVGTFYRGFPDRDALLDELQRRGYEVCLGILAQIRADGLTGADAVDAYLKRCQDVSDELVALPLRGGDPLPDDEAVSAKRRVVEEIEAFLTEGKADGSVRTDVTAMDVVVCGSMIATPLPHSPDWPATSQRHIEIFLRGIRTCR